MSVSPPSAEDRRITTARALAGGPLPRSDVLLPATVLVRMYHEMRRATLGLLELIDARTDEQPDEQAA